MRTTELPQERQTLHREVFEVIVTRASVRIMLPRDTHFTPRSNVTNAGRSSAAKQHGRSSCVSIHVLRPVKHQVAAPVTSLITPTLLSAADRTLPPTCNGRLLPKGRQ